MIQMGLPHYAAAPMDVWGERMKFKDSTRKPASAGCEAGINKGHRIGLRICVLLIAVTVLSLIGLYIGTGLYGAELMSFYLKHPVVIILNILPYLLICVTLWFLTNRAWIGFLTAGVICMVYSFAEYWKLLIRNDPVYAEDLLVAKDAMKMAGNYVAVTKEMVFAAVFVAAVTWILFLLFRNVRIFSMPVRLAISGITAVFALGLYGTIYTSKTVYESFPVWEKLNQWFDNNIYISRGGIYPFLYSVQSALPDPPEGYREQDAEEILSTYESNNIPEEKKISIMMVMLESFCDLSEETTLITGGNPYENYHRLQQESYHGKLVTNSFAGGTVETERSVLTGFSNLPTFRRESWSYVRYFQEQGYTVTGAHAGYQDFYSRIHVNRNIGFTEYLFIDNYFTEMTEGDVPMDWVFLPEVTRLFTEKIQNGETVFSFNVTYQNHGPYAETLWEGRIPYIPETSLDGAAYGIVNNYLNGIAGTGDHLMIMADALRELEEPVILVAFGDHKPGFDTTKEIYAQMGIDLTAGDSESFFNTYETEYLIWGNDAAKEILGSELVGEGPSISPCFLMNVLFKQCGWEGPAYQKVTDTVMETTPVISAKSLYMEQGHLVSEELLSAEAQENLRKMRWSEYYLARHQNESVTEETEK